MQTIVLRSWGFILLPFVSLALNAKGAATSEIALQEANALDVDGPGENCKIRY